MARPKGSEKKLDPEEIEKLAQIGATQKEIAEFLGVSARTVEYRLKLPEFRAAYDRGLANLKLSLRRKQVLLATSGNVTMLIFLGKQLLGQKDKLEHHVGVHGSLSIADVLIERRKANSGKKGDGGGNEPSGS